jgi:hypothetical protein
MPVPTNIPCPWASVTGCVSQPAANATAATDHHRSHEHDERGLYGCHKECGRFYMNLYLLAMH